MTDINEKLQLIKTLVEHLPKPNRAITRRLLELLLLIQNLHKENRMTSNNLAIVFGTNVLRAAETTWEDSCRTLPG